MAEACLMECERFFAHSTGFIVAAFEAEIWAIIALAFLCHVVPGGALFTSFIVDAEIAGNFPQEFIIFGPKIVTRITEIMNE